MKCNHDYILFSNQTCFLPGTVALCVHHECGLPAADAMRFAEELAYTCYLTFARQPTHLAAEITYYNPDRSEITAGSKKKASNNYNKKNG